MKDDPDTLQSSGLFTTLDDLLCPISTDFPPECSRDFRFARQALGKCGFAESDWSGCKRQFWRLVITSVEPNLPSYVGYRTWAEGMLFQPQRHA
jgi:hypothetical protein